MNNIVAVIPDKATINVQTLSGEWLPAKYNGATGFVMTKFVRGSDEYGGSGGSTATSYPFSADNAVMYAINHSDNSGNNVACSKRNTIFTGIDGKGDCADFVHQCLCASGVPLTRMTPLRSLLLKTASVTEFIPPCQVMVPRRKSNFLSLATADMLFPQKELFKLS